MIAHEAALPDEKQLARRIQQINLNQVQASQVAIRAERNKQAFDKTTKFARDLNSLVVGQSVKLRHEKHTKGSPWWFGPFEISRVLNKNAHSGRG